MSGIRTGFELGVELNAHKEGMVRQLDYLGKTPSRVPARKLHSACAESIEEFIIEFIPMAVALMDFLFIIQLIRKAVLFKAAGVAAEAKGTADALNIIDLILHEVDYGMLCVEIHLCGMGIRPAEDVTGVFDNRNLHAEADAEIREHMFPCIARSDHHAVNAPFAEASGNEYAVDILKYLLRTAALDILSGNPFDIDPCIIGNTAVAQRFGNGEICIVKLDILAYERDITFLFGADIALNHCAPLPEIGFALLKAEGIEHDPAKASFFEHERYFIEGTGVEIFNDVLLGDITEQAYLAPDAAVDGVIAAANDDIGLYTDALKLLDRMLGGLCLELSRCGKIRDKRYMNEAALMHCKLSLELADGFKEGLGLDIADGAADFNYHDLGAERSDGPLDAELYLIGDMGYDLNGSALIASAALAVEDCGIDLAGGGII